MLPRVQNVTAATQQTIQGPVTAWQSRGFLNMVGTRELLAAKTALNELVVFERPSPDLNWSVKNVSTVVNKNIASSVAAWATRLFFFFTRQYIAGMDPTGDLLLLTRSGAGNWTVKNISQLTGHKISGPVTRWRIRSTFGFLMGETIDLAGVSPTDELLAFRGRNLWAVKNITNVTGQHVHGELTSWVTRNGPYQVPHIAGISPTNDLLVFWLSTTGDWKYVNVSATTGTKIAGGLCNWRTRNGPYLVEHVAGRDLNGDFWVFWWSPQSGNWQALDVTRYACEKIEGTPAVYLKQDGTLLSEILATRGRGGVTTSATELLLHWWNPATEWQAVSLTEATGQVAYADPATWKAYSSRYHQTLEFVAFQGEDNQLKIIYFDARAREMVKTLVAAYDTMKFTRGVTKDVMGILWDWHDPNYPAPQKSVVEQNLFGASDSVRDYFLENSNGHFTINDQGVRGWYDADHECTYYQNDNDAGDQNQDGFVNQYHVKYKEAIRKAHDDGYDFAAHDADQNNKLAPQELAIVIITPGGDARGFVRSANEQEFPTTIAYKIGGLEFGYIVDMYTQATLNVGGVAHELSHAEMFLGHGDMYFDLNSPFFMRYAAGAYSLMDQHWRSAHLDPFAKLKLGWVSPRLILKSGSHQFGNIETTHKIWALVDHRRTFNEYFLIENRWPGNTYDRTLPDQGLGIWHIMEDPAVYKNTPCPPNMDPAVWAAFQQGFNWSRMAIHMIRPVTSSFNDSQALWDGSDPATGYDLLSSDPNPTHSELKWADGTPSGFAIRSISPAGPTMSAAIEVPF